MLGQMLLAATVAIAAQPAGPDADRIFTTSGYLDDWDDVNGDWVQLYQQDIRLRIPDGPERLGHWDILAATARARLAVRFRFDADAGRLGEGGGHVLYPLCSIEAPTGARHGDEARNCPRAVSRAPRQERLLARGLAEAADRPEAALRSLAAALAAEPPLATATEAIARRARGEAAETLADDAGPGEVRDRYLIEALAENRRVAALRPDDIDAHLAVARTWVALGGYAEAEPIYLTLAQRWPDRGLEGAVRIGALHRQRGDYPRALAALDAYAREGGDTEGMKFRYHRAWTLMLLGRDEEALADVGRGMETQRDYGSAYLLSSCLRARLGDLPRALADQERGAQLLAEITPTPRAALRRDIERSRRQLEALRAAVAAGRTEPLRSACDGLLDEWSRPRPRSPLLSGLAPVAD